MHFAGKLQDFPLSHLIQVLAGSGETGKLRLTGRDREGVLVFRHGKIVYAASSSARQTLGNLLLLQGLLTEEQLAQALDLQHMAEKEKRLGTILVEVGALDEATLAGAVRQQTERVIHEFLSWDRGYFKIDSIELTDFGEVEVDAEDFLMREGLSSELLLTDVDAKLEELAAQDDSSARGEPSGSVEPGRNLASLKSIMGEIRSPEFTGEITQKLLSFAQDSLGRGVLFVTRQDGFGVMGQFGIELADESAQSRLRRLLVPHQEPSVLRDAVERTEALVGPLDATPWNERLLEAIGGAPNGDCVAVPMTVNGKVLLVLYGDRLHPGLRSGWLEELELLMLQAGLAMEKDLLEKRIRRYEELRRQG
jgi:hypothetical protein